MNGASGKAFRFIERQGRVDEQALTITPFKAIAQQGVPYHAQEIQHQ